MNRHISKKFKAWAVVDANRHALHSGQMMIFWHKSVATMQGRMHFGDKIKVVPVEIKVLKA